MDWLQRASDKCKSCVNKACCNVYLLIYSAVKTVWVMGHSFVARAEQRAREKSWSDGFSNTTVSWMGMAGMRWAMLETKFIQHVGKCGRMPDVLIIHLGGERPDYKWQGSTPARDAAQPDEAGNPPGGWGSSLV